MKKLFFTGCVFVSLFATAQQAEPLDTVLLDTKIPLARKNSGKVISKITKEQLEARPGASVAEVLNEVSGIEINGARSNDGQNLAYYVRGGRNRQVVIMVDGVQLNDPSQIANDYDLRLIPANAIEEIEVLKGASSVLYGSGAATAVINITTKKTSEKDIAATFTSTLGSNRPTETEAKNSKFETFTNNVNVSGTLNKFFYNANFSNRYTDGLSAVAAPADSTRFESDVFDRFNTRLNLGYKFSDSITISQFVSVDKYKADFDDFDYTDANNQSITEQIKTGGHFEWKYKNGTYVFNDSYQWIDREIVSGFPSKFESESYSLDTYLNHRFTNNFQAVLGLNVNLSEFTSFTIPFGETTFVEQVHADTANFDIIDPYLNLVYITDFGLNLNAGVRANIHSVYDTNVVYHFNPSYNINFGNNTVKILGSYSTAYITPSLFQLYDPQFGNEELMPEDNRTIEGGVEFSSGKNFRVSAVYFNRNEENFVDFVTIDPENFISQYQNIDETFESSGVEVEIFGKIVENLTASANYTNTQTDERFALRIPEHKANVAIKYTLGKRATMGLSYQYVGEREDRFFNPETFENETIALESFSLLNFNISGQISKNLRLFAGISNILDTEYEEIYRFQTRGRNVLAGFELKF
ncbi:TonB-dependent receptor plug domain-containing protein [Marinirhabdus gelatinilytica]|uniref:Vitamin B12 transporter n=1 Tax=Marinirhabdus gelatinilytica TaxID=1703343 RepID=A0A370QFP5_9FLAO|nr:TonB-dependent receptor plug domain-containing protein [Marinirhabdus gelatinilytica]RDK87187.1 vitamin B12 transporter [Marinirhabdus gelatinilytica]